VQLLEIIVGDLNGNAFCSRAVATGIVVSVSNSR
jgi:hypothetical protein